MKAVVLAAGKGTRLHPLTLTRPKHLVTIGRKPLIDHVLLALKSVGIEEVIFVINFMAENLQQYLGDGNNYGMHFEYTIQEKLKGTADAALCAENFVKDDFMLTYGDWLVTPSAIKHVVNAYGKQKCINVMAVVPVKRPEHYGIVELENSYVKKIIEKPKKNPPSNLANVGIYILSKKIFDFIKQTKQSARGELEITDSLSLLLNTKEELISVRLTENDVCDVGLLWDLLDANRWILQKTQPLKNGLIEEGAHLLGQVIIEKGARIRSGSYIEGPVSIGKNSDIGPNCFIRSFTTIGNNVRVGNACEIKNSIIMDNTHIGHLSYVGDSIIGEKCNLGAGTLIANYRFDGRSIKIRVKKDFVDSGRRKFGVVLGDNVKTGINTLFMPGVKAGPNCWISANATLYQDAPPNSKIILKQEQVQKKIQDISKS